jgi:hypothetical protein
LDHHAIRLEESAPREHRDGARRLPRSGGDDPALARGLPERELLEPGRFAWTGKNPLTTYLGANTASHYRTATKILKRWLRQRR